MESIFDNEAQFSSPQFGRKIQYTIPTCGDTIQCTCSWYLDENDIPVERCGTPCFACKLGIVIVLPSPADCVEDDSCRMDGE